MALQPRDGHIPGFSSSMCPPVERPDIHPTTQDTRGVSNNGRRWPAQRLRVGAAEACGREKEQQLTTFTELGLSRADSQGASG